MLRKTNYTTEKNVTYKKLDGVELKGTLYRPLSKGLKPAVLVVHGGGWTRKSGDLESVAKDLADKGFVVFSPDYRLSPKFKYPLAVEDIRDSLTWLKQHALEFEIDVHQISGWGYSAGAHLLLMVGLDGNAGFKSLVAGGTPSDLVAWPDSGLVLKFLGATLQEKPKLWKEASPINRVQKDSPPVFLYHGTWDRIVEYEQMEKMRDALEAQGREVETHAVSMSGHLTVYFFSQESVDLGIEFIKKHLR